MTDQMMGVIITIYIPSIIAMGVIGAAFCDRRTQQIKMQDEIRDGKIDTSGKGLW